MMNRTNYTQAEIEADNHAREMLAYQRIRDYILSQHKRFAGSYKYNLKSIIRACWANDQNKSLDNRKSRVRDYLAIPSQTLKDLAGWYLRTSRADKKRRVPYSDIIDRLIKIDKIIKVVGYSRDGKRANVYMINTKNKAYLRSLINQQEDRPITTTTTTTPHKDNAVTIQHTDQTKVHLTKTHTPAKTHKLVQHLQTMLDASRISIRLARQLLAMCHNVQGKLIERSGASQEDLTRVCAIRSRQAILSQMILNHEKLGISDGLHTPENDLYKLQRLLDKTNESLTTKN